MIVSCFAAISAKRRLLVHAEIAETQSPARVHMVEVCLKRDHDGFHRSGFGTGLGSARLRIASNCCDPPASRIAPTVVRLTWLLRARADQLRERNPDTREDRP